MGHFITAIEDEQEKKKETLNWHNALKKELKAQKHPGPIQAQGQIAKFIAANTNILESFNDEQLRHALELQIGMFFFSAEEGPLAGTDDATPEIYALSLPLETILTLPQAGPIIGQGNQLILRLRHFFTAVTRDEKYIQKLVKHSAALSRCRPSNRRV